MTVATRSNRKNMEDKTQNQKNDYILPASVLISALILAGVWAYTAGLKTVGDGQSAQVLSLTGQSEGVVLPVRWGNLGKQLAETGVIDAERFEALYAQRGGLGNEEKVLLYDATNGELKITQENSGFLLNLLWALGLGNKNVVLEKGPMSDPKYGGAGNFASTGGWTLAVGDAMNHYSRHSFVVLTPAQQAMVERVAKNIYRPCCNNSTYFPDCNHGMAMLGLLELMASQGVNEADMYKFALAANSYWFPESYLTIAQYLENRGVVWSNVNPKEVLGADFSGASGYRRILEQVGPSQEGSGSSCGVDAAPVKQQRSSGCGA